MGNGFRKAFNIYAWIWNHLWGTLFLAGGVLALASADEVPVYIGIMSIFIGIYFYWSKSWSRAAKKAADVVYDRTRQPDTAPLQGDGRLEATPAARPSATPAESDPVTAKRITIARIVGIAVIGAAFLWNTNGLSSGAMPVFFALLGIGLACLSVPGYIVRLLPSSAAPHVSPAAADAPAAAPAASEEPPTSGEPATIKAPDQPAATPAVRLSALNWVGAGLFMVCVVWIGGPGVRLTMLPVWFGLLLVSGVLFYAVSRSSKRGGSAPRPSPEGFEAPTDLADGVPSARVTSSRLAPRIVIGVAALVIVGIIGAGALSQAREPQIAVEAYSEPSPETPDSSGDAGAAPSDDVPDYGGLGVDALLGYSGEGGEPQYVEIVYGNGSEWYGGDVLLNFIAVGLPDSPEFATPLPNSIPCFVDSQRVSFPEYYKATYESADHRGMIVFDRDAVLELHVFTQGQEASASTAGGEPAPEDDIASAEGDTASFVHFVQDEGGTLLINAEPDGERVYSRPSIMMVRSAEPFFEWAIPLSDSYAYSIGDRPVTGYELFEYISSQGLVRVDVVCDDGRIVSINCWEE